jgi:hypothetical protein
VHFVVVFNLTRFARDKYDHFALRSHLQSLGISCGVCRFKKRTTRAGRTHSPEVPLREREAGAGLQIPFESDRAVLVSELDDNVDFPRCPPGSVRTPAGV